MQIKKVSDPAFRAYGRILELPGADSLIQAMKKTPCPKDGTVYDPSDAGLESLPVFSTLRNSVFGGLDIQVGYCNGHNQVLNALEYHRSSEINTAVDDLILILGREQDITNDFTYDTSLCEAFLVPAGTTIEVYATTLHYAPCGVDGKGFRCTVVLPRETNTGAPDTKSRQEDKLLAARNKWLIAHKDAGIEGAHVGLLGENLTV